MKKTRRKTLKKSQKVCLISSMFFLLINTHIYGQLPLLEKSCLRQNKGRKALLDGSLHKKNIISSKDSVIFAYGYGNVLDYDSIRCKVTIQIDSLQFTLFPVIMENEILERSNFNKNEKIGYLKNKSFRLLIRDRNGTSFRIQDLFEGIKICED